jgi:hypothetical protein
VHEHREDSAVHAATGSSTEAGSSLDAWIAVERGGGTVEPDLRLVRCLLVHA